MTVGGHGLPRLQELAHLIHEGSFLRLASVA